MTVNQQLNEVRARVNKLNDMMQGNTAYKIMDVAGWLLDDLPQINLLLDGMSEYETEIQRVEAQEDLNHEITAEIEKGEEAAA